MGDRVLFLGWSGAYPGREKHALQLFDETMAFYAEAQKAGQIERFEPVLLMQHGGDLNGFVLIHGTGEKIDAFRRSETFVQFVVKATHILKGFGVAEGWAGDGLKHVMQIWGTTIPS